MIDEAFVTAHQGNIAIARQKAINIFYSMAWGIGQPQSIGLTDRFLFQGYDVVFNHVNFTVDIAPNSWNTGSNTNEWAINIRNYWNSPTKRCISKDIMVLFTGQSLGIDGFHSDCNTGVSICQPGVLGSSHVVVVRNQENYVNTAKTLAHEILHAFGLGHLNEILTDPQTGQSYYATVCHTQCALGNNNDPPALMCVHGGDIKFTSCDINCIDRFFTNNKCICLNQQFGSFPDDFICPPPDNVYINIVGDRPNPVIGCRIGEDEITFG
ncbi:MAG: hypothetical protein KF734_16150 [Saprospiraceae bacterium]|nr:hypothetical protein [Saprospiraceae bacterium]